MALIPNAWKNTKNELREQINGLTDYGTDNLSWKQFDEEKDKEQALVIVQNIQAIEKILKKFGTLQKIVTEMSYAGIGWTLRLKTRRKIYIEVAYSDERFKIRALSGDLLNESGYSRFVSDYEEAFTISKYTHYVSMDNLEDVLTRFKNLF